MTPKLPRPRPDLEGLAPYRSSDTARGRIFLHANENPYALPDAVMDEILDAAAQLELNRYPDPDPRELVRELAAYAGVDPEWVWIGDGSNEVLLQSCLAYGGPGRSALLFEPTYRMHHRQARMAGTAVEVCSRTSDFSIEIAGALEAIERRGPDIVFVCTPNNPTGTVTPIEDVKRIAQTAPGLMVVDEAYFEFSGETIVPDLSELPNVMAVRTMSKAFRLAGVRLGYGIADPRLLEPMRAVRMPYAQSSFTQGAALIVLRRRAEVLDKVPALIAERERLAAGLAKIAGVDVFPSGANFVMFRHPDAAAAVAALAKRDIVVRDFTHLPGCEGCLRVTAGLPEENNAFLEVVSASS